MPLPIIDETFRITTEKCSYCNETASFKFKNGKFCCHNTPSKCRSIRYKNSNGLNLAYRTGKRKSGSDNYKNLSDETKDKMAWNRGKHFVEGVRSFKSITPYECSICKISTWLDNPLVLDVDHIDGDRNNNSHSNLRYLCPNCHSQTPTYKYKNADNRGKKKVSDEELLSALQKCPSVCSALKEVGLAPKGGNYKRAYNLIYSM